MKRREFITLVGGAAAWPVIAWAQQTARVRHIGIVQNLAENDPVATGLIGAFLKELGQRGWITGDNIRVETRWAGIKADDIRQHVAALVALAPDVILANGTSTLGPLLQASRSISIVFVQVTDPVGSGYVASLARPGGNATGFATSRIRCQRKMARSTQAGRPARNARGRYPQSRRFFRQRAVWGDPGGGTVLANGGDAHRRARSKRNRARRCCLGEQRERRLDRHGERSSGRSSRCRSSRLAARHKLPAVYWQRHFVAAGGFISYGDDGTDQYTQSGVLRRSYPQGREAG